MVATAVVCQTAAAACRHRVNGHFLMSNLEFCLCFLSTFFLLLAEKAEEYFLRMLDGIWFCTPYFAYPEKHHTVYYLNGLFHKLTIGLSFARFYLPTTITHHHHALLDTDW